MAEVHVTCACALVASPASRRRPNTKWRAAWRTPAAVQAAPEGVEPSGAESGEEEAGGLDWEGQPAEGSGGEVSGGSSPAPQAQDGPSGHPAIRRISQGNYCVCCISYHLRFTLLTARGESPSQCHSVFLLLLRHHQAGDGPGEAPVKARVALPRRCLPCLLPMVKPPHP